MNPFPCSATASAKLQSAAARDASRRPPATIQRLLDPQATSRPLPSPTASPTPIPTASSRRASPSGEWPAPWTPSSVAATTRVKATIGVTMPSLSPLSTLRARRSRIGICSSLTTWALRAASVGASVAATKQTMARDRSAKHHAATIAPSTSVRGRPNPEQTCREADVLPQPHHVDPGRVREEQERKRGLRQDVHRWRVDVDGEGTPVRVRQQVAGDREDAGHQ